MTDSGAADLFGLKDKAVLITGATSIISVWAARLLLDVGARVAMTDRLAPDVVRERFRALAEEGSDPGLDLGDAVALIGPVDIRNRTPEEARATNKPDLVSVSEMVAQAVKEMGGIDVLINVAGGQEPVPAAVLSTDLFRRTVERILLGTWNVIHEVFEQSMRDRGGRILTITADTEQGYPGMPGMGAARNGLSSLCKALAVEWAPMGITNCVIAPGIIDTAGLDRYPDTFDPREVGRKASNLGRLFEPREIAWLFLTMASPWSVAVNGHTIVANGGDSFITPLYRELVPR